MKAVFADTFYWVTLTDPNDALYEQAVLLESAVIDAPLVTTDEVLAEFLTFFANSPPLRRNAVETVRELTCDPTVRILPRAAKAFKRDSIFTLPVRTRNIASPIVSPCMPFAAKG